jgi:hypothetical protein
VGAEHLTPSDAVWLGQTIPEMATGVADPARTIAAIRGYITSFFDATLLGKPFPIPPSAKIVAYPGTTLTTGTQALCPHLARNGDPQ